MATVLAAALGVFLYQWNFRAPHFGVMGGYSLALVVSWFLTEPKVDSEHFSLRNYFSQLGKGAQQLTKPALIRFLPLMFMLLGMYFAFSSGFIKPAMAENFGFDATVQGFLFAGLGLLSAGLLQTMPWLRVRVGEMTGLLVLTTGLGAGFILAGLLSGWVGLAVIALIVMCGSLAQPWVSTIVNQECESQYRATTLSTISMMVKLPYVVIAVLAGSLFQAGDFEIFSLVTGGIILSAAAFSFIFLRTKTVK